MSAHGDMRRCERCGRATAKKRLAETAVGRLCAVCRERLPRRLKKTDDRVGRDKEDPRE